MEQFEAYDSPTMMYFFTSQDRMDIQELQEELEPTKEFATFQTADSGLSTSVNSLNRISYPLFTHIEGIMEEYPLPLRMNRPRPKSTSKKGSLKFCRRLCKSIVPLLEREAFSMRIFAYFGTLMSNFLGHLDAKLMNRDRFNAVSRLIFHRIWKKHRELLACTHNNKICLVTPNEWDSFFGSDGFESALSKDSQGEQEILHLIEFRHELDKQVFKILFAKALFILNVVFINTIIFCEMNKDEKFLKSVPNYEAFAMMVNEPWLCKHFNHAKEKFALECCNKCKICRSGAIPPDFLFRLQKAREKLNGVQNFYARLDQTNILDINEEQVIALFTFWSSQMAM